MRMATKYAREMVETFGFSDEYSFMALSADGEYTCSEAFREKIDEAVNELLNRLYYETVKILSKKKKSILALAEYLFNHETISGDEFKELYERAKKGEDINPSDEDGSVPEDDDDF